MFPYIPISKQDEEKMLQTIGVDTVDELFTDIPDHLKLKRPLDLPKQKSEIEIRRIIQKFAEKNTAACDKLCFLGGGVYDSYIPSIVPYITSRSEFATAYTPYQPEISQGTLHGIFEFQTLVANLTDMHCSNASLYDGPTAATEAALMSFDNKKKGDTFLISSTVNMVTRQIIETYLKYRDFKLVVIDEKDYVTDVEDFKAKIGKHVVGVLVQSPNHYGLIENYTEIFAGAKENKALSIMYADPSSLGILKTPGEYEVDIAIGEMQQFGNAMHFGGPHLGFMAVTKKLMRKMPGRIVGQGLDHDGKRAFVLTLQAREQHIRRDKASSNICSNQALNAMGATIYMSLMGKQGIRDVAINATNKAHYLYEKLVAIDGVEAVTTKPFYREFMIQVKDHVAVNNKLSEAGILPLLVVDAEKNILQVAVTENRTKEDLDYLAKTMEVIS